MGKESVFELYNRIRQTLLPVYANESESIAMIVTEELTKLSRTQIITDRTITLTLQDKAMLAKTMAKLQKGEPIQYIFSKASFYGREFWVTPKTLIPRPETEGLVDILLSFLKKHENLSILDVGTGCGCIPITISLETRTHNIEAMDIDSGTLEVAKTNGIAFGTKIKWFEDNMISMNQKGQYDVIVSNPPYVLHKERKWMETRVLDYEPEKALFVPDDDPVVFYRHIFQLADEILSKQGHIFLEINEQMGPNIVTLGAKAGFQKIQVMKDLSNKDRYVHLSEMTSVYQQEQRQ